MAENKNYPLSFEEFEEKVIELLLNEYGDTPTRREKLLDLVDALKNDDFFVTLYSDSCYREDKYGNAFSDEELINQPVRLIMMFYED